MSLTPQSPVGGPAATGPGSHRGDLIALAVLNFVFGGMGLLGAIYYVVLGARGASFYTNYPPGAQIPEFLWQMMRRWDPDPRYLLTIGLLSLLFYSLMIVSGVGYLKRSKALGPGLAYAWAVLMFVTAAIATCMRPWLGAFFVTGLPFPVITLVMLKTTLKNDFVS